MKRSLWRGLTLACAVCGSRGLIARRGFLRLKENCPRCGLRFERVEGQGLGAVAVNTVVSAALILASIGLTFVIAGTDVSRWTLLLTVLPFGTIFPVLFDPFSRTIWTAIDVLMRPPGPDEVATEYARTVDGRPFTPTADSSD